MVEVTKPRSWRAVRHVQMLMLFVGMLYMFTIKVNMSIAVVAMTDSSKNGTFTWSHQVQSVVLSSFKWGYIILKVPGGELAARYGGMLAMSLCTGLCAIASLALPIAGYYGGWQAVCVCRFLQGLALGVLHPAVHNLVGKWAPLEERSRVGSLMFGGGHLGTALELVLAGFIADYWGWEWIFYVGGIVGVVWTTLYLMIGSSSPQDSKIISPEERLYIQTSLGQLGERKRVKTPWRALFTSAPFLALVVVHGGVSWGYWTFLTEMPTYLHKVQGVNIKKNGIMSSLPYFASFALCFVSGWASDFALARGWLSVDACRKTCNSIATFVPALLVIGLSYVGNDVTLAVALLTVGVGISTIYSSGFALVHLDMAPNHAGTMIGITGLGSNLVSMFAPLTAGYLIFDETLPSEWRKVFFLAAGVYVITNTVYLVFGTSEKQPWNDGEDPAPDRNSSDMKMEQKTV